MPRLHQKSGHSPLEELRRLRKFLISLDVVDTVEGHRTTGGAQIHRIFVAKVYNEFVKLVKIAREKECL